MPWLKELVDIIKRQRKHASFFEWPDKEIKEVGVVKRLFESMENACGCPYSSPRSLEKDPPDCIALDRNGKTVGIEVSELVDQDTVRRFEQGNGDYKLWQKKEALQKLESILLQKDRKHYQGGPYSKLVLVIFTDEPFLDPDEVIPVIEKHDFPKTAQISDAYLLFSYDARIHGYSFVKLKLSPN